MSTNIPHPDRLAPGDCVGPWKILNVLGAGGLGRVFLVEQGGRRFALKMAVRLPGERAPGEEDVDGRCMREATAMLERTPHPHIPRIFQVGRWPDAESGFLYILMEHIDGWRFHDWRYEKHPTAAQLVDVLMPIARTLADLHKAGIHHRDLNANNILIRREDGRPFLLDFGSARLPGARTLTQGLPPVDLSVVPPEAFEQLLARGDDARFEGGEPADLYALGVLLYTALTDGYPFNSALALEKLVAAIRLHMPRAPHRLNPKAPRSLSDIAMRLLAKRPEERFESAEALHRALWQANKERTSREWKVPMDLPESGPAPMTEEEVYEEKLDEEKAQRAAWAREQGEDDAAPDGSTDAPPVEEASTRTRREWTWERTRCSPLRVVMACALVAGLVALAWWGRYPPPNTAPEKGARPTPAMSTGTGEKVAPPWKWPDPEGAAAFPSAATAIPTIPSKDSVPVKTLVNVKSKQSSTALRAARKLAGAAITCSALAGCQGPQVRPAPPAEECPPGAVEAMEKLGIVVRDQHVALFDPTIGDRRAITVREGRASVFVLGDWEGMPGGTELAGRLIFGERVFGRLTEARMDGRTLPVCIELEDVEGGRGTLREPNGGPDTVKVLSSVRLRAVRRFE